MSERTGPPLQPEIGKLLHDKLIEELRNHGLTDDEIVSFMKEHDQIMEEFVRKTNEARAGFCPKCGHSWAIHDTKISLGPGRDVYECNGYMGMGDWCGCEERSRRPVRTSPGN